MITKDKLLYEGKAKKIYKTNNENNIIMYYKDSATAFNGLKKDVLDNKGVYNNKISTLIYTYLENKGVKTHWIKTLNDREQLCEKVKIYPLEVIIRNIAAGSFTKRLGVKEGTKLLEPVFELSYKNDSLNDPLINDDHTIALNICTRNELAEIKEKALVINDLMKDLFDRCNLILVDFKIEFGKNSDGEIVLADEISPDSTRLWEKETHKKLDKDRFRQDLGDVMEAYAEVFARLEKELK